MQLIFNAYQANVWFSYIGGGIGFGAGLHGANLAATTAGKKVLSTFTPKMIKSGLFSGTVNTISHYDSDAGTGNLLYFASGFIGGAVGAKYGPNLGMISGGYANVIAGNLTGNISNRYEAEQHFVGGALSGVMGWEFGKAGKMIEPMDGVVISAKAKAKMKSYKLGSKGLSYGLQATASDFAYTPEYYYNQRTMAQHSGIFGMGVLGGVMQGYAMDNPVLDKIQQKTTLGARAFVFASQMTGYGIQYAGTTAIMGYNPIEYEGLGRKATISGYKSLMYSLTIR